MKRDELMNGFKRINGRTMFVTKKDIAEAFGVKQTRTIGWVVEGLEVINGKYYFLPDVEKSIRRRMTCRK